jgi:hypothetical protein
MRRLRLRPPASEAAVSPEQSRRLPRLCYPGRPGTMSLESATVRGGSAKGNGVAAARRIFLFSVLFCAPMTLSCPPSPRPQLPPRPWGG